MTRFLCSSNQNGKRATLPTPYHSQDSKVCPSQVHWYKTFVLEGHIQTDRQTHTHIDIPPFIIKTSFMWLFTPLQACLLEYFVASLPWALYFDLGFLVSLLPQAWCFAPPFSTALLPRASCFELAFLVLCTPILSRLAFSGFLLPSVQRNIHANFHADWSKTAVGAKRTYTDTHTHIQTESPTLFIEDEDCCRYWS